MFGATDPSQRSLLENAWVHGLGGFAPQECVEAATAALSHVRCSGGLCDRKEFAWKAAALVLAYSGDVDPLTALRGSLAISRAYNRVETLACLLSSLSRYMGSPHRGTALAKKAVEHGLSLLDGKSSAAQRRDPASSFYQIKQSFLNFRDIIEGKKPGLPVKQAGKLEV